MARLILGVIALLMIAAAVDAVPSQASCSFYRACTGNSDCQGSGDVCCNGQCITPPAAYVGDFIGGDAGPMGGCLGSCSSGALLASAAGYEGRCERHVISEITPSGGGLVATGCPCQIDSDCFSGNCVREFMNQPYGNCSALYPGGAPCKTNLFGVGNDCATGVCLNTTLKCTEIPANSPCVQGSSTAGKFLCAPGQFCVKRAGAPPAPSPPITICAPLALANEFCQSNLDCATGLVCNQSSTPTPVCVTAFSAPAGTPCNNDYECASKKCAASYDSAFAQGRCAKYVGTQRQGEVCPDGDVNCLPGHKCIGKLPNFAANPETTQNVAPTCQYVAGQQCAFGSPATGGLSSSACGFFGACNCKPGDPIPRCVSTALPSCQAESLEFGRFYTSSGFPDISSILTSPNSQLNGPIWLHPQVAQDALAAYVCCACKNDPADYNAFAKSIFVQGLLGARIDCGANPPKVLTGINPAQTGQCSAANVVPLDSMIMNCRRPPPGPAGKSAWQKAKVPVIIAGSVVGFLVVVGAVAGAVLVLGKGKGTAPK
eukprot:a508363_1104.p1 GENE.a508363_1104~~a508363_1104.p1  ORF type:complete len:553 (+),score=105.19 a508363_1104:29-1660(+)